MIDLVVFDLRVEILIS